jgi:hypothetical protein
MTHDLVRIPRSFLDDHAQRDLDTPKVWRSTRRHYWIDRNDPATPELLSDATFYADGVGHFDAHLFGLISSARATAKALTQEVAA